MEQGTRNPGLARWVHASAIAFLLGPFLAARPRHTRADRHAMHLATRNRQGITTLTLAMGPAGLVVTMRV